MDTVATDPLQSTRMYTSDIADISSCKMYTPVRIRDPRKFTEMGYTLQCKKGTTNGLPPVKNHILVSITMYNESPEDLMRTLRGVCSNLSSIMIQSGDPDFWRRLVVCIIADGRSKLNTSTMDQLSQWGLYNQSMIEQEIEAFGSESIGMHIFERTVVFEDDEIAKTQFPPLQLVFALKEHNAGKLDSHWWILEAFAHNIEPLYCFLLDVGTMPRPKAFFSIYRAMQRNPQVSGSCGEIATNIRSNLNHIVAAQSFEYRIANILDKSLESIFGYITVLPGAFSAFRYRALAGKPLRQYFSLLEDDTQREPSILEANAFLAEDRILCFELAAKANEDNTLHFVSDSVAETDVPDNLVALIKQRRRWLNGSLFALLYSLSHTRDLIWGTSHSWRRKIAFFVEIVYLCVTLLTTWLLLGSFCVAFDFYVEISLPFQYLYFFRVSLALCIVTLFYWGFRNSPQKKYDTIFINFMSIYLGFIFSICVISTTFRLLDGSFKAGVEDSSAQLLYVSLGVNFVIFFFAAAIHKCLTTIAVTFFQFLFMIPTFVIIMPIFAFCNINDISWGTKSIEAEETKQQIQKSYSNFRNKFVVLWIFCNALLVILFLMNGDLDRKAMFIFAIFLVVLVANSFKLCGSIIYRFVGIGTKWIEKKENNAEIRARRSITFDSREDAELSIRSTRTDGEIFFKSYAMAEKTHKDTIPSFIKFLLLPLRLKVWVALGNVLIFNLCSSLFFGFYVFTSSLCVFASFAIPIYGLTLRSNIYMSWRYLAKWEFDFNSTRAFMFDIVEAKIKQKATFKPPSTEPSSNFDKWTTQWMNNLDRDPRNWFLFIYFVTVKPVLSLAAYFVIGLYFGISVVLMYAPAFGKGCDSGGPLESNHNFCNFMRSINGITFGPLDSPFVFVIHFVAGLVLLLFAMQVALYIDRSIRRCATNCLGFPVFTLVESKFGNEVRKKRPTYGWEYA